MVSKIHVRGLSASTYLVFAEVRGMSASAEISVRLPLSSALITRHDYASTSIRHRSCQFFENVTITAIIKI